MTTAKGEVTCAKCGRRYARYRMKEVQPRHGFYRRTSWGAPESWCDVCRRYPGNHGQWRYVGGRAAALRRRLAEAEAELEQLKAAPKWVSGEEIPAMCPMCKADPKVFCPRNADAICMGCHLAFCGAHIGEHLKKAHCVSLSLDHCRETGDDEAEGGEE